MGSFTYHAPAERVSDDQVSKQSKRVEQEISFDRIWKKLPVGSVILNDTRQIVSANDLFLNIVNAGDCSGVLGKRPGEAVGCVRVKNSPGGCGTSKFCVTCGAVNSIMDANAGRENSKECAIILGDSNVLELSVWSMPMSIDEERFVAFAVQDISNEKRRRALERIFFHDINNTLACLSGYSELLNEKWKSVDHGEKKLVGKIGALVSRLVDEISEQSLLLSAERRELDTISKKLESRSVVEDLVMQYNYTGIAGSDRIKIRADFENIAMLSDKVLISRVLGNMIKNGLEAGGKYAEIKVGCQRAGDKVVFSVHNPGVIPEDIQLQIFKRSFSTKGVGRGIGTYSMKFLSMNYLKGDVWFESDEKDGTTFYAEYPLVNGKVSDPGSG